VDTTNVKGTAVGSDVLNPDAKQVLGVKVVNVNFMEEDYDALNQVAIKVQLTLPIDAEDMVEEQDVQIVSIG